MANFNSVVVLGRLTRDPELRYTPQGVPVCSFSLAVSSRRRSAEGSQVEDVAFLDVEVWRQPAETSAQFLKKGSQVLVYGALRQERWKDEKTGRPRSRIKVVARDVQFLPSKGGENDVAEPETIEPDPADVEA